jgi:hypothetical protein
MGRGPGPGMQQGTTDPMHGAKSKDAPVTAAKHGHGFAQTDTVKHCPFCGSGDVWGGSDGTITCEFDGATFQVSVEPQFPSAPGNIDGVPLNIDGAPDQDGQADADEAWAVPNNLDPSAGSELDAGGGPSSDYSDDAQAGSPEDEGSGGGMPTSASYRTHMGDMLSEPLYLKHLAIRHAEVPQRFLASLRSGR